MIAVQIGVEPMSTTVQTATPVFRTEQKKSSRKERKLTAMRTRYFHLKLPKETLNFPDKRHQNSNPAAPINILASVMVKGVAPLGANC